MLELRIYLALHINYNVLLIKHSDSSFFHTLSIKSLAPYVTNTATQSIADHFSGNMTLVCCTT